MDGAAPSRCREIFEAVIEAAVPLRHGLLRRLCGADEALRQEVERLLVAYDSFGDFLETAPSGRLTESEPLRVGRYELVRKLGEGGMGRVYLAEPGPVAVKLIRRDLDPGLVFRRFTREREMLRRLDHPHIARLIDGGTTEDGTLYLVLSYIDGEPLDDYCRHRAPTLPGRIHLFRALCEAVSFAHGKLVIHRDLKPANILVTNDGAPVVLDFGLAKLARTNPATALDSTRTGHRLLTPEYASPEQVKGHGVTAATDIYALGLILYELLAGARAQRFTTWSMAEIVDVVCNAQAEPPSRIASFEQHVPPALDSIVMKALAKDPAHRYSHVAALDDDLGRYLEGRPIPGESRRYQT